MPAARIAPVLPPGPRPVRALVRACAALLAAAERSLGTDLDDAAVHALRRDLKRSRALLRMARPALGAARFRAANGALRDAGRALSSVRDARVQAETLDAVRRAAGLAVADVRPLAAECAADAARARAAVDGPAARAALRRTLRDVRVRLQHAPPTDDGWPALAVALERIYRDGRRAYRTAVNSPAPARLHEWRKHVKYAWHALEALEPVWPRVLRSLAKEAHSLADRLGEDHDLALVRERLAGAELASSTTRAALAAIDARRAGLQRKAFEAGARLYAERPSRPIARLGEHWGRYAASARPTRLARGSTS